MASRVRLPSPRGLGRSTTDARVPSPPPSYEESQRASAPPNAVVAETVLYHWIAQQPLCTGAPVSCGWLSSPLVFMVCLGAENPRPSLFPRGQDTLFTGCSSLCVFLLLTGTIAAPSPVSGDRFMNGYTSSAADSWIYNPDTNGWQIHVRAFMHSDLTLLGVPPPLRGALLLTTSHDHERVRGPSRMDVHIYPVPIAVNDVRSVYQATLGHVQYQPQEQSWNVYCLQTGTGSMNPNANAEFGLEGT